MTRGLTAMMTATISTKRPPAVSSGKRGATATHLTGVSAVPLLPASSDTFQRPAGMSAARELWETFTNSHAHTDDSVSVTQLPDIRQGDVLVSGSVDYQVVWVGNYPAAKSTGTFLHIVCEEVLAQS